MTDQPTIDIEEIARAFYAVAHGEMWAHALAVQQQAIRDRYADFAREHLRRVISQRKADHDRICPFVEPCSLADEIAEMEAALDEQVRR